MERLEEFKRFGESLGLIGKDLSEFIIQQQNIERDERQRHRDEERYELDFKQKQDELKIQQHALKSESKN